jgi:transposase
MNSPASVASPAPASRQRQHNECIDDLRATVVRLRCSGRSWSEVQALTSLPRSTMQHILQVWEREGRISKKQRGGNLNPVYTDAVRECVISAQDRDSVLRLQDLANEVENSLHLPPPSLSTVWRMLKGEVFTTKNVEQYANARNTPETKQKRAAWCRDVGPTLEADTSIWIDETPFSFCIMRSRGRSRKGQPAIGVVPAIRGRNHTVIAAISPTRGLLYFEIKVTEPELEFISKRKGSRKKKTSPRGVNRDIFRNFLIHLFTLPLFSDSNTRFTLLCDNARIHKGDIDETIFQAGHSLQYLAAWSPELNPIEYAFSKWKLAYRALFPATEEAVDEAIRSSSTDITPLDCQHYFQHTQSLYAKAVNMEDL